MYKQYITELVSGIEDERILKLIYQFAFALWKRYYRSARTRGRGLKITSGKELNGRTTQIPRSRFEGGELLYSNRETIKDDQRKKRLAEASSGHSVPTTNELLCTSVYRT